LRDIRKDAGLTGRRMAALAGWHSSKISKIEYGRQTPSEDDIRIWCELTGANDQLPDLVAAVRHIESMYVEWRHRLGTGVKRRQRAWLTLEQQARLLRWYEPVLVPGILHTAEYASAVIRRVIDFYQVPDDVDQAVAARMERQHILYRGQRRFHFVLANQALLTMVGDPAIMIGQLDRLLAVMSLPRVTLGIIPPHTEYRVPTNQFVMFDDRFVNLETVSAELSISQPREIKLYAKAFDELSQQASYGPGARALITAALTRLRDGSP
jgi:transcriptional regulator with XRE-family HTH domain